MTVICNATPLINLAVINHLHILKALFQEVIIPVAVYEETTINNFPSSQVIFSAIQEKWLQVQTVASIPNQISNLLDKGER
ncbi:MAG TPA: hypothetical protein V6C58_26590, partial [Allocoleopsis sp.]